MKNFFLLIGIFLMTLSVVSFAQLDSVWYQGPVQGSVLSGAIQNTDNFTDELIINGETKEIPLQEMKQIDFDPTLPEIDQTSLTPSIYVEDLNAGREGDAILGQEIVLQSFPGIGMTNYVPPDPTMAVGPNHIIVCANSLFKIFDKQGNQLKNINAGAWWAPVSAFEAGDPQVLYDHYAQRWILGWMEVSDSPPAYGTLIAYSDDSDPLGVWYIYRLSHTSFPDYPKLGFDEDAIYIMSRQVNLGYNRIRIVNKAELYASNAGPLTYKDLFNIRTPNGGPTSTALDVIHPAISYTPGSGAWFFWARGSIGQTQSSVFYAIYKITNPLTNPGIRGKLLPVPTYFTPPLGGQLGGGVGLETIGWMSRAPIVRDGFLYAVHDARNSTNASFSSVRYLKVNISTSTPSIVDNIEFGNTGYFYLYPGLTVDKDHNVVITYTRSATTEYAGAYFSTRLASDPPGVINPSIPIQVGLSNYQQAGSGRNRWGDYMGIYLDPVTERNVWMLTEFANTSNSWGTQVGEIITGPYSGAYAYLVPRLIDFKEVEIGTKSQNASVIVANYGDADLVISAIPSTFDDFKLESTVSFPLTVASYDSLTLEFSYSPTAEGEVNVVYPITSNDPQLSGVPLTGVGYDVVLSSEKVIYASSGTQNNGDMLTVDPVTGAGTIIGTSLFNEVTSISINPLDGKIYGLAAGTGSSQLLKINAAEGDAHVYFTINIPQIASIAFDTTGVLYAITRTGDLYTIDVTTGLTTFVVDAAGSYLGMAFHPATNELWATTRAVTSPGRETIFKVNLTTGDTTIVGRTGLGKQTNAIFFDENLNLFGVIGSSNDLNDFISINPSNGVGTIIGSIGFKHILGLAYLDQIISSVEDDNEGTIPSEYALKQNYPNPFNPNTKIDFSLPVESNVKLIIYNILGQEVIQLVNNEMTAGNHSVIWNANDAAGNQLTSGIYLYKLTASGVNGNEFQDIKKMILLK
ncbi:MAG: T9SS type A sorting domain-containing protein [Ignavibacteriaceae bacterium]|nr:T9SS type A sorting domain-containing protein [Ignavibacteriaceae bacterium]